MKKLFMLLMASAAIMFVGCNKSADPSDPSDPGEPSGETPSLYKQWDCIYAGTRHDVIDLTGFNGGNTIVFGDSYDGSSFSKNGEYPGRVEFNADNLSGTISYNSTYGAFTLEFQNLTATTCEFKTKLLGDMMATFHTYNVSNHTLQ